MALVNFKFDYYEDRDEIENHFRIHELLKIENAIDDFIRTLNKYEGRVIIPKNEINQKLHEILGYSYDQDFDLDISKKIDEHCKQYSDKIYADLEDKTAESELS